MGPFENGGINFARSCTSDYIFFVKWLSKQAACYHGQFKVTKRPINVSKHFSNSMNKIANNNTFGVFECLLFSFRVYRSFYRNGMAQFGISLPIRLVLEEAFMLCSDLFQICFVCLDHQGLPPVGIAKPVYFVKILNKQKCLKTDSNEFPPNEENQNCTRDCIAKPCSSPFPMKIQEIVRRMRSFA